MKSLFFVTALLFVNLLLNAQVKLSGRILDGSTKQPLIGATIAVTGTNTGVVSDENGDFSMSLRQKNNGKIKVSFIGYVEQKLDISALADKFTTIELEPNQYLTEEVFVYSTRAGQKTPTATTTITRDEISSRNIGQDVPYMLSSTPSFVSTSDAGAGVGYTGFRIRGTDDNRVNITVNGVPINDAESHGVWFVNMPDFMSSVEDMQVQRGVGTSTLGAGAFGASINMQTNSLKRDAYAEYSVSAGSFNTMKNTVRVGSGLINDHFSIEARLSKINSDGFIDRAFSDLKSFFVSGGFYSDNTIVKLNIFSGKQTTYQAWNGVPSVRLNDDMEGMKLYGDHGLISERQTEEMIASNSRTYNLYTYDNETDNYQQDHYQLLASHCFNSALCLNVALHYTRGYGYYEQERIDDKLSNYGLPAISLGDTVISRTDLIRQKLMSNDFYGATFSLVFQNDKSDATFGGGWNCFDGDHFGKIIWMKMANDTPKDFEWYNNNGLKKDLNLYLKYNYAITSELNIYADMQYRNIDYKIDGLDDDFRDITQTHIFNFFNPKLGLMYQPSKRQKVYASWSVANREPNRDNYTDAKPGNEPTSERLNDFEVGYSYKSKRFSAGANLYYMSYKNQLILTGEINDVGDAIMTNVDKSYRTGIELMAAVKIAKPLTWNVNATFSQNKIIDFVEYVDNWDNWETGEQSVFVLGNTDIAFSPKAIVSSTLDYHPIKNMEISLLSQYVGKQFIDNSMSEDRVLDAYFVNNLKASYSIYPKWINEVRFSLLVNNIFNTEYETDAWIYSYIYGEQRYKMDGYFPQAGTNFLFGIDIRF